MSSSPSTKKLTFFWIGMVAALQTILLNQLTHLITKPGLWYSRNEVLFLQSWAFFKGHLVLDSSPFSLEWDYIWHHGVTQPWGLGVPAFRAFFDVLARLAGYAFFPDRITFLIAYFVCAFVVLHSFASAQEGSEHDPRQIIHAIPLSTFLLLAPPFVTLVKTDLRFYEEVVAYSYLFTLLIFVQLMRVIRRPNDLNVWILCGIAGVGPFIRPTLIAYSAAALLVVFICLYRQKSKAKIFPPMLFFIFLLGILGILNKIRFGSFLEFGSKLNLENLASLTFFQKFGSPPVRWLAQMRDQLGALFFQPELNGPRFWQKNLFPSQIAEQQWHEMYFTTYSLVHLVLLLFALVLWLIYSRRNQLSSDVKWTFPFTLISFLTLFIFYARFQCFSSRYSIDFLAAIFLGMALLMGEIQRRLRQQSRWPGWTLIFTIVIFVWMGHDIANAQIHEMYRKRSNLSYEQAMSLFRFPSWSVFSSDLRGYSVGMRNPGQDIPFNTNGWDSLNGRVQQAAIFFVKDPASIRLTFSSKDDHPLTEDVLKTVCAKIGLELLERTSLSLNSGQGVVTFAPPRQTQYKIGLQVCFVGFATEETWTVQPHLYLMRLDF